MKKIITLMLVFALALGCLAGCGDDEKEGGSTKALTFTDVSKTMEKMSEGASFELGVRVNLKPVFNEYFTKEDFETAYGSFAEAKADGTYDISLKLKGESAAESGKIDLLLKDTSITDLVISNGTIYLNAKALFTFYVDMMKAVADDLLSAYADFLKWPYENEYVDLQQCMDLASVFDPGISLPEIDDILSQSDLDPAMVQAVLSALSETMQKENVLAFLNHLEDAFVAAKALTADQEKIEFELDKTNIKAFVVGVSAVLRTDLADITDTFAAALKNKEELPEEFRQILSQFDKEAFQKNLDTEFAEDKVNTEAEELAQEIGEGRFCFSITAKAASCSFKVEILGIETETAGLGAGVSQMGLSLEIKLDQKNIANITAPEKVLTDEELQGILKLLGDGAGDMDFGDLDGAIA